MNCCEVVAVRNVADAVGVPCTRTPIHECDDCGIQICESHTEKCATYQEVFCSLCLSFHEREHSNLLRPGPQPAARTKDRLKNATTTTPIWRRFGRLPTPHAHTAGLRLSRRITSASIGNTLSARNAVSDSSPGGARPIT